MGNKEFIRTKNQFRISIFIEIITYEHIDYLIKLVYLILVKNELIIIIKVLRKRLITIFRDENNKTHNMLDKYMEKPLKEKNNINIKNF